MIGKTWWGSFVRTRLKTINCATIQPIRNDTRRLRQPSAPSLRNPDHRKSDHGTKPRMRTGT
jgi:hypothetical protein